MFDELDDFEFLPKLKVVGVGGGGINAVNKMIESTLNSPKFKFIAVDSNKKALSNSQAAQKILIGKNIADSRADFEKIFADADLIFIVAGIGGKTGTSAAPFIAEIAKKSNAALTVAVVNTPFSFENPKRSVNFGLKKLCRAVNTLIEIPNEATMFLGFKQAMLSDMMKIVDDMIYKAVQNVAYVLTNDGRTAIDFGDLCMAFKNGGFAMIGIGEASGKNAPVQAAKAAINSPFLYDRLEKAHRVFVNIIVPKKDFSLLEGYQEAITLIEENLIADADFFGGIPVDENLGDTVRVTIIAMCF